MPNLVPIDDPCDARIDQYRDVREGDLVGRQGLFIAEGKVVLEKLLRSSIAQPLSLLIASHRVVRLAPLLSALSSDVPVYSASQPVIDAVAGFQVHRGILAIGRRRESPSADVLLGLLPTPSLVLLLSGIANHDNMGGIFRNAAAFGADAVLVDPNCCDPLYRKAIRVSVGASLLLPWTRLSRDVDPIGLLVGQGYTPLALSPSGDLQLSDLEAPLRAAVLLGAEGPGLNPDLIARATSVRIPMAAGLDSLNVATASGIVLHHLWAARGRTAERH